jgi:hypothetical protein
MEDHDIIIKHDCEISELIARDTEILGRFDKQDVDYENFKHDIFNKLDRTTWWIFTGISAALLSGLIYVVFLRH